MSAELPQYEKIKRLTMAQHASRIQSGISQMVDFLNKDRQNMKAIKQFLSERAKQFKNQSHELMINLRSSTQRLKGMFAQINQQQRKDLNGMKSEFQKLSAEQLKAEQLGFRLQEKVNNAENQIGFKDILKKK